MQCIGGYEIYWRLRELSFDKFSTTPRHNISVISWR